MQTNLKPHQKQNRTDGLLEAALGFFQHKRFPGRYTYGYPLYEGDPVNGAELQKHWMADTENYYIYRNESKLIQDNAKKIVDTVGRLDLLADLGCGASFKDKIKPILMHTLAGYAPIDINPDYIEGCSKDMKEFFPARSLHPIHADFKKDDILLSGRILSVMFGNTITNWGTISSIADLLKKIKPLITKGHFAFTHDTNHDLQSLHRAYRHPLFAEATLSPLFMIKRDLETENFDPTQWAYLGKWDPALNSYDACMVPKKDMIFSIEGHEISVKKDEIFVQASLLKYPASIIEEVVKKEGFEICNTIYDYQNRLVLQIIKN